MRLTEREGEDLLREGDLIALGREADKIRKERFGNTTTFIIDRNINYTNVCVNECRFCAFFRRQGSKDAYLLSHEEILEKVRETVEAGGTQVMIQGGLYPELGLAYYEKMLRLIKEALGMEQPEVPVPGDIARLAGTLEDDESRALADAMRAMQQLPDDTPY